MGKKTISEQVWDRIYPLTDKKDYGMIPPCIDGQTAFNELVEFFMGKDYYIVSPMHTTQANTQILYEIEQKFWKYRADKKRGRK